MNITDLLSSEYIGVALCVISVGVIMPCVIELKKTNSMSKKVDTLASQESVNTKASQESVNTKASQESVDYLAKMVASQESVDYLAKKVASQESQNSLLNMLEVFEKHYFNRIEKVEKITEKIYDSKNDNQSVSNAMTTISGAILERDVLKEKIMVQEMTITQLNNNIQYLLKENEEYKATIETLNKKIETLEKQNEVSEEKVHEKEHDDYEIEM